MLDVLLNTFVRSNKGFALELGAADGLYLSNTLHLEERGWRVLCIEANPIYEERLRKNRKEVLMAACGAVDGEADLPIYQRGTNAEPVASLDLTDQFRGMFCPDVSTPDTTVRVPLHTLDYCLNLFSFPYLDFLSLDTDGYELEILRGFSLGRWRPAVAIVENPFENPEIRRYFCDSGWGYQLFSRYHVDDLYVRGS